MADVEILRQGAEPGEGGCLNEGGWVSSANHGREDGPEDTDEGRFPVFHTLTFLLTARSRAMEESIWGNDRGLLGDDFGDYDMNGHPRP